MRFLIILLATLLFAGITSTRKEIQKTKYVISKMNQKLDALAKEIQKKEKDLQKLNKQINNLNNQIKELEKKLKTSNKTLSSLIDLKKGYQEKANNIQNEITNFISENYFVNTIKTENINDLINKEISKKVLEKYSHKINELLKQNKQILVEINKINENINSILKQKEELKNKKKQLTSLLKKQKKELASLKQKKEKYKQKLNALIQKQKNLQKKLVQLKIIKKRKETNINVKKVNVYFKPKIANYRGPKTIPPVRGKIVKKFGSYIDPIYKIRIYNDSITIKPYKPNSLVRSILSGRVVYIGENNDKKIIVIKHKNNLFSIYANLDKISPLIKKGSFVKRGQIIARVKDTLEFEVTYKDRPINPTKVISIK